jgi:hypothetical protein
VAPGPENRQKLYKFWWPQKTTKNNLNFARKKTTEKNHIFGG